jgi:hypothetical protein
VLAEANRHRTGADPSRRPTARLPLVLLWITGLPAVDGGFASQVGELRLLRD